MNSFRKRSALGVNIKITKSFKILKIPKNPIPKNITIRKKKKIKNPDKHPLLSSPPPRREPRPQQRTKKKNGKKIQNSNNSYYSKYRDTKTFTQLFK